MCCVDTNDQKLGEGVKKSGGVEKFDLHCSMCILHNTALCGVPQARI